MQTNPVLMFVLAAALSMPIPASAQASDDRPVYKLKSEDPYTGTSIRHDLTVSTLPYNKTYAQLSEEDKLQLRSVYENMGPGDEPPFPLRGYKTLFKAMHTVQRKLMEKGDLVIVVNVDAEGNGTGVKVYKSPDPELTQVVSTLMILEKYKPALCKGQPCAMDFPLHLTFTVKY